jgi:hypothetical protein
MTFFVLLVILLFINGISILGEKILMNLLKLAVLLTVFSVVVMKSIIRTQCIARIVNWSMETQKMNSSRDAAAAIVALKATMASGPMMELSFVPLARRMNATLARYAGAKCLKKERFIAVK